jgi:large subunit ribosomal protein L25
MVRGDRGCAGTGARSPSAGPARHCPLRGEDDMPPARPVLAAASRNVTGKQVARLRKDGRLPAVVYGHGLDSANVSVDAHEFEQLRRSAGPNQLIDLAVDGRRAQAVLVHGVQRHPVTRRPLHVDLFAVRLTEELAVDVPLVSVGESPLVDQQGGTLFHALEHIRVRALPEQLPQSIEYSVEALADYEDSIHVRDLAIPSGVTLLTDPGEVVAKVLRARVEGVPAPEGGAAPEGPETAGAGEAEESAGV